MVPAYDRLYAEAFSRRTLVSVAYLLVTFYTIFALLLTLGGRLDWLGINFFLSHALLASSLTAVLIARLRPVANPGSDSGAHLLHWGNVASLVSWMVTNILFVRAYFFEFAPSYLTLYAYPEGKYGPPLLREQPFFLTSFAIFLAGVSYFQLGWRHRGTIKYHLEKVPSVMKLLTAERFHSSSIQRLGQIQIISLLLLMGESLLLTPHTFIVYATIVGRFYSIRRASHSFWEVLDLRLIYHFAWAGASLLILYVIMEVLVEVLFGQCFHLCQGSKRPTALLLSGLKSTKAGVRTQALLELRHLMLNEPAWRAILFREFIGDEAASRILSLFFVQRLKGYRDHIEVLNEDLCTFSHEFEKVVGKGENDGSSCVMEKASSNIFSPRRRTIFESILNPHQKSSTPSSSSSCDPLTLASRPIVVPEVFEVKSCSLNGLNRVKFTPEVVAPLEGSTCSTTPQYTNGHVKLAFRVFKPFARSFPGKVYSALSCEIIKSWWFSEEEALGWMIESLTAFVIASYEEDCHGQVQFVLAELLEALASLIESLGTFEVLPLLYGRRMLDDLFGALPSPTERRIRHLSQLALLALEKIIEKFSDSLDQLKIEVSTREKLRKIGLDI